MLEAGQVVLNKLVLAWRKAKVDLYYSTNPSLLAMADYEADLFERLDSLLHRINGDDEAWVTDPEFIGDWILAPSGITSARREQKRESGLIFASPDDEWSNISKTDEPPSANFRLMARCSMDFHVLSALWVMEVGQFFDKALSDNVYGSRLRRTRDNEVNDYSLGTFKPYLRPFREWRDGCITTMRDALKGDKKILALTADASSFYHRLNPSFMLDDSFHAIVEANLNDEQIKLNRLFINAILAWGKETPLENGLPVGLPASAVVANLALIEFDRFIKRQLVPLYYGRYVDDILLVMENTSGIDSLEGFWGWILSRKGSSKLLGWRDSKSKSTIEFHPEYLSKSEVVFDNNKNKLFILSDGSGKALVNAIAEQINQRASEWRALPNLPDSPDTIATDLVKATNFSGEQADNLHKTDGLTLHRAGFALSLRDYEAYGRDLPSEAWQAHRHAFFNAVIGHLITPIKFFELSQYMPRIIRLAVACEDFEILAKMVKKLDDLVEGVEKNCELIIKSLKGDSSAYNLINRWQQALWMGVTEGIVAAFPARPSAAGMRAWDAHMSDLWTSLNDRLDSSPSVAWLSIRTKTEMQRQQAYLFSHDLAHVPLRFSALPREMVTRRAIPARKKLERINLEDPLPKPLIKGVRILGDWLKFKNQGIPFGLVFSTRPFTLSELYLVAPAPFCPSQFDAFRKVIFSVRGFTPVQENMPQQDRNKQVLYIPDGVPKTKQTIAVASWETTDQSFVAAVMREPDPGILERYRRLNRLINELISRPDGAGYLILPELALPSKWFMHIAQKLNRSCISLITGVEYLHARKKRVRNQIWASLTHDGLGFPSLMLYCQDKQRPALHEEQELYELAGFRLQPETNWHKPPIVQHGAFRFALMICSELTNIRYRSDLRGKVDALFVPEWNSDTETFNALVESASLDVHAYIIQCNNRRYGDSRIRAPYKKRWQRDVLRVKGGNHDYAITGEIDIQGLRQFQSRHRSPADGFKPVPDGFNEDMAFDRKELPKGE